MSADNWAICPRCRHDAHAVARAPLDDELFRTFREDYEFYGAEDGEVVATYEGHCKVCGLTLKFDHAHPLYFAAAPPSPEQEGKR